jgi:hypothetical protein
VALGWDRLDHRVRCSRQEPIDEVRAGDRFRLGATVVPVFGPDPANANSGRSALRANQTTSFFLVSGFGSGAYSAKLLAGTMHRFSGLSQPRQCGEAVLRILVTGKPPALGGGGMPQRIITISRSPWSLRTTGAG